MQTKLHSGYTYTRGWSKVPFMLVYLFRGGLKNEAHYGMLHFERHDDDRFTAPMFQHDKYGAFCFTEKELFNQFNAANWKLVECAAVIIPSEYRYKYEYLWI